MFWKKKKCDCDSEYRQSHLHWKFAGYHTCLKSQSSTTYDDVLIKESAKCHKCGRKHVKSVSLPQKLIDYFHANYKECMSEDPLVIAKKKREEKELNDAHAVIEKYEKK